MLKNLIIAALVCNLAVVRAISASEVKDFSVGFFLGMGVNEAVPDAEDCIMATENLVTELKDNKSFVYFFEIMKNFFTNAPKCFSSATQSDEYVQKIIHLFDKNSIEDTLTSALISRKKVVNDFNEGKEQYLFLIQTRRPGLFPRWCQIR
jgi:hypothetical protein